MEARELLEPRPGNYLAGAFICSFVEREEREMDGEVFTYAVLFRAAGTLVELTRG